MSRGRKRYFTDEEMHPLQERIFRAMTPARRYEVARALYWQARALKTAGVREAHPDWTEEQVTAEVRRIFLHAHT